MTVQPTNQRGRKTRIGKVCYANNRLAFFAGYNECESCGVKGKVLMNVEDARTFSKLFGNTKEPLGARFARRLARHYMV